MSLDKGPDLRIRERPEEMARECAKFILEKLDGALTERGRANIAISGGSSPKLLFAEMARADFDWSFVHFFWVDERCVPPGDEQSNFKMANDALLAPAGVDEENIHRIYGELPPGEGAARYVEEIRSFFELGKGELPAFDVLHRGMGPDAHTASLFPGEPLIRNRTDIAINVWVEKFKMHRVTLLPGVLLAARCTVLQVAGADKADALHNVLAGPDDAMQYPCQIASRDDRAYWFVDTAAAAKL